MIALDTNVLIRYLVEDDARQSALAVALFNRAISADESLFVSDVVVCEAVWVLSISYEVTRTEISSVLRNLFRARHLTFNAADQLLHALHAFESGKGDFADYLIREQSKAAGCEKIATFDKGLLREPGFAAVR